MTPLGTTRSLFAATLPQRWPSSKRSKEALLKERLIDVLDLSISSPRRWPRQSVLPRRSEAEARCGKDLLVHREAHLRAPVRRHFLTRLVATESVSPAT